MSQPTIRRHVLALAAILIIAAPAKSALAAGPDKAAGVSFAVLDFQKLSTAYKAKESVANELNAMRKKFDDRLARRDAMPFLSEDEQKQLDDLYEKTPAPSDADKNKIKEIEGRNKTKADEIQALRMKKSEELTQADKDKLSAANETFRDAQKRFLQLSEDLKNQLNAWGNKQQDDLMGRVRATIAKIAEQKGFAVVFNNEVALYSGTDITDQVVGDLNKNANPKPAGKPAVNTGFAMVDVNKVSNESKARADGEAELNALNAKFEQRLARRDGMPLLTEEEQKQLDDLYEKDKPSDADKNKIKELEAKNKTKSDEILAIKAKKDDQVTAAEKEKLKATDDTISTAKNRFAQLKDDLTNQLGNLRKAKLDDLYAKIRASIARVAKQENIATVFNSEVALYAGTDLTDQVIVDLNKQK